MKKLSLPIEELKVDSFDVADAGRKEKGTVEGYISRGSCPWPCTNEDSVCYCATYPGPC